MKIEVVKLQEEFIREIEDFDFDGFTLSRVFTKAIEEGQTLKITAENQMRLGQIRRSMSTTLRRKGIRAYLWIKHYTLYVEHCGFIKKGSC